MIISDELLAAYLEGNIDKDQLQKVLQALREDAQLRARVEVALAVGEELGEMPVFKMGETSVKRCDIVPMMKLAAKDDENICSIACEAYVLQRRHIQYDMEALVVAARENHWLKKQGTPLHAIGQLLAQNGLLITRKYDATIDDLIKIIGLDNDVIAAVDIQKLYEERPDNDDNVNHAVVVTEVNVDADIVTVYDPLKNSEQDIPLAFFKRAWHGSHCYLVRVLQSIQEYDPEPIRLDDVSLSDNLIELREAIAENLHDVWAITRMKEGWTWGPERNDEKKQHPDLIPYCALPDGEREYDRLMAWNTLKLVKKLGFEIKMR